MRHIFLTFVVLSIIMGCAQKSAPSYPSQLIWGDVIYGLSTEEIQSNAIEKELGEINNTVTPLPQNSGEANTLAVGTKLYKIRSVDIIQAIAVKKDNKYFKASKTQ